MDDNSCLKALTLALLCFLITTTGSSSNSSDSNSTDGDGGGGGGTTSSTNGNGNGHSSGTSDRCKISEFRCTNGTCISSSKYCDGTVDCIDRSDEPVLCSVCNQTLYGETGKTYELEIRQPKDLPFVCHLNFTAPGGNFGDIIQINFDKFNIGRFISSFNGDQCLDGSMRIIEQNFSPSSNGEWCGSAWGYTVYYSETRSINITIRHNLQHTAEQNFEFKLSYKYLKRNDAKLRYDGGIWTGDIVPGTYCDKNLYDCDKRMCRIRSPNYPGVYPRNVTCKYVITHRQPPNGMHAMIVVRQPDGHKLNIKEQTPNFEQSNRALRSWDQCDLDHDFLSIKDGPSSDSPELARLCGGDVLPDIISSGPNMLIEFKTASTDSLFHPSPISYLLGFELQVQVIFVNANSHSYIRQPGRCDFILNAYESPSGELESPQHTLPPNTVCRYQFQGRRHETVWLSFVKYHSTLDPAVFEPPSECSAQLRIWDGRLSFLPSTITSSSSSTFNLSAMRTDGLSSYNEQQQRNASLMAEICREEVPKLCSRSLIAKGTRPCSTQESYLSTGPEMTIEYKPSPNGNAKIYGPNSAFKIRYEFVDTALGGAPMEPLPKPSSMPEPAALTQSQLKSCDRIYRSFSSKRGVFRSPSNVFMFGRGGTPNISCTIRFEANPRESVRLTITRARFGGRSCQNIQNRSGRWHCNVSGGPRSDLRIGELPWSDIAPLPRDCLCSDISGSVTLAPLASSIVEVRFTTLQMGVDQDFRDFYFEGRYEFATDGCETDWTDRRLKGRSGEAYLKPSSCSPLIQPWFLEPETPGGYLVLKLKGFWMPTMLQSAPPCPTDARITVYPTNNPKNAKDLCPSGPEVVAFSDGWEHSSEFQPVESSKGLILEYRSPYKPGVEMFDYKFSWMEVFPGSDCPYVCPELQACIPSELWCDGVPNCPSGYDESPSQCEIRLPLSPLHVGLGAACLTILLSLAAGLAACIRRRRVEKKQVQNHHLESNGRGHPHYHCPPHTLPPLYLDTSAKDSFC